MANSIFKRRQQSGRLGRFLRFALVVLVLAPFVAWAAAALWFDGPPRNFPAILVICYLFANLAVLILVSGYLRKTVACLAGFGLVLAWWLMLAPSNDRAWQPDLDRTASAEIDGDHLVIHNLRNIDYRTELDFTPRWETREYDLAAIEGVDLFVTYWGSEWIAHPIVSFRFRGMPPLAISVEARKEKGEAYSAIAGFFRQYELIYILADERDVIRLRTNYREGEEVYVYRTNAKPAAARAVLLDYLARVNQLNAEPSFYNALTSNCTTNIRVHTMAEHMALPWDWRLILNGKADSYAFEQGRIVGPGPFAELKRRAHINDAARAAGTEADFSTLVRRNRPGFD